MTVELFDPIEKKRSSTSLFPLRDNEPEYAKLKDIESDTHNRYGNLIELAQLEDTVSLNINGVDEIGFNINRNKQHAFHFTADNCIGCHACESACSEKNDLPAHISFRSVGYVEGGSYPDYTRMNISMACNHCDDPVCLKGCPTRAYTKHEEYGAVIQDPDICFGCGYCTWVCPYNAPQLDPVAGQVEKCNMCVDRLEVGLKPACVSACLGNALNFGVVENMPENRDHIDTCIPGFPSPEISKPNIRFQQTKAMPDEVTRTDSMPVKYKKDGNGNYQPMVDQKTGLKKSWNLARLSSRENPLVIFTLSSQAAIGLFITLFFGKLLGVEALATVANSDIYIPLLALAVGLIALGLLMSTVHLGKPMRFYRGFNNLRHSPVAREGLGIVIFMACVGLHLLASLPSNFFAVELLPILAEFSSIAQVIAFIFAALAVPAGLVALYYMYRCYRIKARPFWDHWHTAASFFGTMLNLGAVVIAAISVPVFLFLDESVNSLLSTLAVLMTAGLSLEAVGLYTHHKDLSAANHEGAASHYIQRTTFGNTYLLRNILIGLNLVAVMGLGIWGSDSVFSLTLWSLLALSMIASALIGRALFYVLVVPTTMPGAFFWKNKGFEQHARDIGLADMPQVGVAPLH
ncbi:DmsC/YnfH family molybdoenzyme membrane anchor subunit [Oceanicoccus sp. KOV_DT_Chl]|uniref:DmsC/YnfH family molybdoenzyme membrane anchor subunit n=1 Tax=Oceanicoccus sp. KOV_DT_Chl TaxID=1904639 RepID=UPI000C79D2C5|nr:DmsC/YnfH family molybdoenzyme membrane anchor subunit [Oceanicoccus sp. KOV_DT_Chl]